MTASERFLPDGRDRFGSYAPITQMNSIRSLGVCLLSAHRVDCMAIRHSKRLRCPFPA